MKCNITFTDATLEEAQELFHRLGMDPNDVEVKVKETSPLNGKAEPEEEEEEKTSKKKTAAKKKPAKKKTSAKKPPKEEPEEEEEVMDEEDTEEEEDSDDDEEEDSDDDEEEDSDDDEEEVDIKSFTRLRDVLMHLIEQGCEDEDDLVKQAKKLQKNVPVLKKINNLEERVRRAAQVLM